MIRDFRLTRLLKPSIPAALLALFAVIIAVTATRWGIGVDNDSVGYLNLWIEPGLAPLLRWMHAALGGLGVDITVASRWLFVILMAANVVLVYYALYGATRSVGASFLGAVLVFAPVEMLQDHLMVYSEPVYLLCGLIGFLLLSRYLETAKLGFLVLSAVAVALAFLSRFVGLALVVTGGLSILFWSDKRLSNRILHSVIFAIISTAPTAIYLIYRTIAYETAPFATVMGISRQPVTSARFSVHGTVSGNRSIRHPPQQALKKSQPSRIICIFEAPARRSW